MAGVVKVAQTGISTGTILLVLAIIGQTLSGVVMAVGVGRWVGGVRSDIQDLASGLKRVEDQRTEDERNRRADERAWRVAMMTGGWGHRAEAALDE